MVQFATHTLLAPPDEFDFGQRRVRLAHLPTPVEPMDTLARALGLEPGRLLVKRDDATGLGMGGNKVRKLEYICAAAVSSGAEHLVTAGLSQSNHGRQTAAASVRLGMACTLVFDGTAPAAFTGNLVLDTLFGARLRWVAAGDPRDQNYLEPEIRAEADRLIANGVCAFPIMVGGSTPLGALGYVRAGCELRSQVPDLSVVFSPSGSGGTHAGLAVALGTHDLIAGVRIGDRVGLDNLIASLAAETAALAGLAAPSGRPRIDEHLDPVAHNPEVLEAIMLAARTEGLILDPVYSGRVMAGLIHAARSGALPGTGSVVFLHTGGGPGLLSSDHSDWLVTELGQWNSETR